MLRNFAFCCFVFITNILNEVLSLNAQESEEDEYVLMVKHPQ